MARLRCESCVGTRAVKLLITGATGFIGRYVTQRLLLDGHEILVAATDPDRVPRDWPVRKVSFQDLHGGLEKSAVREFAPDTLLHLAWAGIPNLDVAWSLTNVAISARIVSTALECGVSRVVGVGSCREYPAGGGKKAETDAPSHTADVFAQAKLSTCQLLRAASEQFGAEWRWARPFFVYGPGQRPESLIPAAIGRAAQGEELTVGSPTAAVDFVNVTDVAEALHSLATQPGPSGAFNIGSGRATNVAAVASWVRKAWSGAPAAELPSADAGQDAWWADITSITAAYDWKPTVALEEGIRDMIDKARS